MAFKFTFSSMDTEAEAKMLLSWMRPYDLGYKGWNEWLDRIEQQVLDGRKRAVLAFSEEAGERDLAAYVLYQQHKQIPNLIELKSIRTHPKVQKRYFMSFMLKQVEVEAKKEGYAGLIGDLRENRGDVLAIMLRNNFRTLDSQNLYEPDKRDIIVAKMF